MTIRRRFVALIVFLGLVVLVAVPRPAAAQTESQLLTQISQQPRVIAGYLDLARLYFEQRRFDDAQRMLMRAMALIDQQKQTAPPAQVPVPYVPTPGGVRSGVVNPQAPVRVGGDIAEPKKIKHVPPVYPAIAQAAGVQGLVILEAIVDTQGDVRDVKVLRSVPLLEQAAIDAVRQWRFTPTLLNTVPVEVIMTVTVNFTLTGGPQPVRIGGGIREPQKITHVAPIYPADAQAARVSGLVIIEATIDTQGNVADARVLRSVALLDQAAVDAVKQWKFAPTLLNGAPVPVIMTVTVNFSLSK